jgi:hypothetical protein
MPGGHEKSTGRGRIMNHNEKRADFFYKVALTIVDCKSKGIDLMPFRFHCTKEEQDILVEQGKSLDPFSRHLEWLAIDVVIIRDGQPVWKHVGDYNNLADNASKNGLFVDRPGERLDDCYHLEYTE